MDYCFETKIARSQGTCLVLVVYDDDVESISALPVSATGPAKVAVDWRVGKLDESGYSWQTLL